MRPGSGCPPTDSPRFHLSTLAPPWRGPRLAPSKMNLPQDRVKDGSGHVPTLAAATIATLRFDQAHTGLGTTTKTSSSPWWAVKHLPHQALPALPPKHLRPQHLHLHRQQIHQPQQHPQQYHRSGLHLLPHADSQFHLYGQGTHHQPHNQPSHPSQPPHGYDRPTQYHAQDFPVPRVWTLPARHLFLPQFLRFHLVPWLFPELCSAVLCALRVSPTRTCCYQDDGY